MPEINISTGKIHYRAGGNKDAPALVFIHGSGCDHRVWPEELFALDNACVYAVDLPAHGLSGGKSAGSVAEYALAVEETIHALELFHVILAGHSLGGAIAQTLALQHPEWLSALILMGTGARLKVLPAVLDGLEKNPHETISLFGGFSFGPEADPGVVKAFSASFAKGSPKVLLNDLRACNQFDIMDKVKEITCCALVICAENDSLTPPKYGKYLAEHLPASRFCMIEKAGHMMALEQPDAVCRCIRDFLLSTGKKKSG